MIIQLKPTAEKRELLPIKRRVNYCAHVNVEVDEVEKVLTCTQCNISINPFDYVLSLAYEERNLFSKLDILRMDIKNMSEEKERLQKDIVNLKATKRRNT